MRVAFSASRKRHPGVLPDTFMTDFRHALRALVKPRGFQLVATLTIAVGIGANTALFSVYDRLVLNPVTISRPASLVALWINNPQLNFNAPAMSWPKYEDVRRTRDVVRDVRYFGVRQLHADQQRRSRTIERPAGECLVLANARRRAGART